MQVKRIEGATRTLGKSQGFLGLPLRDEVVDGQAMMVSAWEPTPAEVIRLEAGASIIVRLWGEHHPPIKLEVGEVPHPAWESTLPPVDPKRGGSRDPGKAVAKPGGFGPMSGDNKRTADYVRLCEFMMAHGGRWPRVTLDGVEQQRVILVDQAAGMVRRLVMLNGALQLAPDGESLLSEDVFGDVGVEPATTQERQP